MVRDLEWGLRTDCLADDDGGNTWQLLLGTSLQSSTFESCVKGETKLPDIPAP